MRGKGNGKPIYEFLGMTKEQYFEYATGHERALKKMFPRKNNSGKD